MNIVAWLIVALLIGGVVTPVVKALIFLAALGISVVAEKCKELENGSN